MEWRFNRGRVGTGAKSDGDEWNGVVSVTK